jgi:parvulin-like peptidyl-prolyl isomerase
MASTVRLLVGLAVAGLVLGCGSEQKSKETAPPAKDTMVQKQSQEPDVITVQHILIAFQGTLPGKPVNRTKEEAQKLAEEILEKTRSGGDFDALVKEYTDDSYPGIYKMANFGAMADPGKQVYSRGGMVPAFGNVGFSLKVGEVGLAPYDPRQSPYGWHIIKRIE